MVSPVQRIESPGSQAGSGEQPRPVSPMRQRLMEIMQQVEIAKESVQKAIHNGEERGRRLSLEEQQEGSSKLREQSSKGRADRAASSSAQAGGGKARSAERDEDIRAVRQLDRHAGAGAGSAEEVEDELEDTLAVWLLQQRRGVTVRRKASKASDDVEEDAALAMYATEALDLDDAAHRAASGGESKADSKQAEVQGQEEMEDKPLKAKYLLGGDDVEVVGLQCMLAKALMGDDEDDDYDNDK
jgi:hypothetical protein